MILEHTWALILLIMVPAVILLRFRAERINRKKIEKYADERFRNNLLSGYSPSRRRMKFILRILALALTVIVLAGPMVPGGEEKIKLNGIDLVVALDVSNSMRAEDLKPNRLERAKTALNNLLMKMEGDRLGIVVFAGKPYTSLPLTDDRTAAQMVIESVSTDMVGTQGTAIGAAIDQAVFSFAGSDDSRGKAILVITDGENHEDNAPEAAEKAAEKGIIVCTIGIGSAQGTTIPELDDQGKRIGNKRDKNGAEVITKLDESTLKETAKAGKGIFVKASSADLGTNTVYNMLSKLSKSTGETIRYTSLSPFYRWLALMAIVLLLLEGFIPETKKSKK